MEIAEQINTEAAALHHRWESEARWSGIERPYTAHAVVRLRGRIRETHSFAPQAADKLWNLIATEDFVPPLGCLTGNQAVECVKAGLRAIYLSGWQVAADANLSGQPYPDQSLSPANSVPAVVQRINNALRRADQIAWSDGREADFLAPIVADAEAGFGGPLNAFELMSSMIKAGAAGGPFEDQLSSEKKCGHLGGKVLIPTGHFVRTLTAARLAADVLDVPTVLIARTDALAATLLPSDIAGRDAPHERHRRARPAVHHRSSHRRGLLRDARRDRRRDRTRDQLRAVRRHAVVRDLHSRHGRCQGVRRGGAHAVPRQAPRLQLLAVVQLEEDARRRADREVPEGARRDGLPLPVHHARRLPRAEREHVRSGQGLRNRGHDRVREAPTAGVRDGARRLHGGQAPGRGRHRL